MKKQSLFLLAVLISFTALAQNVGIGTNTPNTSAQLDISSSVKGLLIPGISTSAINSISNPARGLLVYDSAKNQLMVNMGTPSSHNWRTIVYNSGWNLTGNTGTIPSSHFIGTIDNNSLQFRINNKYAGGIDSVNAKIYLGYLAGHNTTNGYSNVGIGYKSLYSNTKGHNNTAIGDSSLFSDTIGLYNTASGIQTLFYLSSGDMNTATGGGALYSSIDSYNNAATGADALYEDIHGSYNTATGEEALFANTGISNTATGYQALTGNTTGGGNTAIGTRALWTSSAGSNTANGYYALNSNTTGAGNTAAGYNALYSNYSGSFNTANGSMALSQNQFADNNTAGGYSALRNTYGFSNSSIYGVNNTGTGAEVLTTNTTGVNNTAIGRQALYSNSIGGYNTAAGGAALFANSTGVSNTAMGYTALYYNTGSDLNTAIGANSLYQNTGYRNTGIGGYALFNTTAAQHNTVVGYNSAAIYDMGYNNTILGANCDVTGQGYFNCIAIGQAATCTGSNQVSIGNAATWSIGGFADWTNLSDGRYKKDIKEDVKGLDFIMKLRPVTYRLDITGISKQLNEGRGKPISRSFVKTIAEKEKIIFSGFVAQEVEQSARELNYDFGGIEKPANANGFYSLCYDQFVAPLIKGMQEQQQMLNLLKKQHATLKDLSDEQDILYEKIVKQVEQLEASNTNSKN